MNFSHQGIQEQLKYEGYSDSECKYAADNCGADWFDQAAGSAEAYLSIMSFSKSGLIEQLEYDGYSLEEAAYGAAVAYGEEPEKPAAMEEEPPEETEAQLPGSEENQRNISAEQDVPSKDLSGLKTDGNKYDLSGLSYDELLELKEQVNLAIWASEEWQEVTVPQGTWEIGADIPEGKWTLRMADDGKISNWCGLTLCDALDESGTDASRSASYSLYKQLGKTGSNYPAPEQLDFELKEGLYLIIENSDVVFTPYAGKPELGFK